MKKINKILFDLISTLCALHLVILCLILISQGCNKKIQVNETKESVYLSKKFIDTINVNSDTIIYSNKVTREYHNNKDYFVSKITVHPDTIKTVIEKTIKEKTESKEWYFDFWKVITVIALFLLTIISLIKLLK